jgi:hypothetical protein
MPLINMDSNMSVIKQISLRTFRKKRDVRKIKMSKLFDEVWYLNNYRDVKASGMDPALHYLLHGAREARDPGPYFSTKNYWGVRPEVEKSGKNALLHFEKYASASERLSPPLPGDLLAVPDRDRALNRADAASDVEAVRASEQALADLYAQLPDPAKFDGVERVPRIFHFIYGFHSPGDIPYFGYMAIRSALAFNPGWAAYYYCMHVPAGPNWDRIKTHVKVIQIKDFSWFNGAKFHHYAHKSDVVRLILMNRIGGVYLDLDTITRKSYEDLRSAKFCMGVQAAGQHSAAGLCNAVMIGQASAEFSERWLAQYEYFRSKGRDDIWDYHSVKLPSVLAAEYPDTIRVCDYRAFFYPLWTSIEQQLFTDRGYSLYRKCFDDAYCFHLWHGGKGDFLSKVDREFINNSQSIYAHIARDAEGIAI